MELNDNDRQRIEQEAKEYGKIFRQAFIEGAEYATIYERAERSKLEQENLKYKMNHEGDHDRIVEQSKKIKQLEAERSELVKLIGDFWESYRQFNAIPDELENRILNSIKK